MRRVGVVIALIASGCYSPSARDCAYTCDNGACPSGLHCVNKFCREDPGALDTCSQLYGDGGGDGNGDSKADGMTDRYKQAVLASTPTAYWRLGEEIGTIAYNENGSVLNGSYIRMPALAQPGALTEPDTAVRFSTVGGVQCMTSQPAGVLDVVAGDAFTIEAWVNTSATPASSGSIIAGKLADGGSAVQGYAIDLVPTAQNSQLRLRLGDGTTGDATTGGPVVLLDSTWHYIVVTYLGATGAIEYYVDGVRSTDIRAQAPAANGVGFTVACRNSGSTTYIDGLNATIDEVAFYKHVVPMSEVMAHYAAR